MNDLRNRERLLRAQDLVDQVSAEHQAALNDRAAATLNQNPGPIGIGRMLAISRRTDALERIARELSELLDHQPTGPAPAPVVVGLPESQIPSFAVCRKLHAHYKAELARLELLRLRGDLVVASEVLSA